METHLDTRTFNALQNVTGIRPAKRSPSSERELLHAAFVTQNLSEADILKAPNFGKKSLSALRNACAAYGIYPSPGGKLKKRIANLLELLSDPEMAEIARSVLSAQGRLGHFDITTRPKGSHPARQTAAPTSSD